VTARRTVRSPGIVRLKYSSIMTHLMTLRIAVRIDGLNSTRMCLILGKIDDDRWRRDLDEKLLETT
jgi:hypothetical protein